MDNKKGQYKVNNEVNHNRFLLLYQSNDCRLSIRELIIMKSPEFQIFLSYNNKKIWFYYLK